MQKAKCFLLNRTTCLLVSTSIIITVMINKTISWLAIWVVNIFCRIGDLVYLVKLKYLQVHLKDQPNSLRVRFSYLTHLFVFLFLLRYDLNLRCHTAAPRPNPPILQKILTNHISSQLFVLFIITVIIKEVKNSIMFLFKHFRFLNLINVYISFHLTFLCILLHCTRMLYFRRI
jgi:hypothetical protein